MSDSGFDDERARPVAPGPDGALRRRRPTASGVGTTLLLVVFVGLAGWAWLARAHTADLKAWDALSEQVELMDRSLPPLGHSESAPCREEDDGVITRGYPQSTGPQVDEIVGFLTRSGWVESPATAPAVAHLTRTVDGAQLTVDVEGSARNQLATRLVARSPGSALGCLLP